MPTDPEGDEFLQAFDKANALTQAIFGGVIVLLGVGLLAFLLLGGRISFG